MTAKRIHVMAAVIKDADGRVLIARRPEHVHQGGLWEFPGGKLEAGESRLAGLERELFEELGIRVEQARPLLDICHDYADKQVRLDVWLVDAFTGEPHGAEGQPVRWVLPAALDEYAFPAANAPIVTAAQLPERYVITPDLSSVAELVEGVGRAIAGGARLIQLRQTRWSASVYAEACAEALARFAGQAVFMLKGDAVPEQPGCGWHLTARQLATFAEDMPVARARLAGFAGLVAASCHDARELALAAELGVDFVTLSPLLPTASHPGVAGLGWQQAAELIARVNMPVYVLGGMRAADCAQAFAVGAQGVAGIRGFW